MDELTWPDFAPYVRARVARKFPVQREFARALGELPATVSLWLKGRREPRVKVLSRMANLLDTTIADLLTLPSDAVPAKKPVKKEPGTDVRLRVLEKGVKELTRKVAGLTEVVEALADGRQAEGVKEKAQVRATAAAGDARGR